MDVLLAIRQADLRLAIDLLLREEPGIQVVGVAREVAGLMALLHAMRPDVLLLDWNLSGQSLDKVVNEAHHVDKPAKIIALCRDEAEITAALAATVDSGVIKGEPPAQLLKAIHEVGPPSNPPDEEGPP